MNTSEELKIVKESTIEMVEEDDVCTRTVDVYRENANGQLEWQYSYTVPC